MRVSDMRLRQLISSFRGLGKELVMKTDVAAVMFADLVDYTHKTSNQSHRQNAKMLEHLAEAVVPCVRDFGGRIVKELGDAVLAVFQSPTDAVKAGMAVQDKMVELNGQRSGAPLRVRVAINVGEVRRSRGDIFGEAVNIAARIESQTPAEEIYLSESTVLTMNRAGIPIESVGNYDLKGIDAPIELFRVPPRNRLHTGLPYDGTELGELRNKRRRRRTQMILAASLLVASVALGGFKMHGAWQQERALQQVDLKSEAGHLVEAAEGLAYLHSQGQETAQSVERWLRVAATSKHSHGVCMGINLLSPHVADRAQLGELSNLKVAHAFALVKDGEVAKSEECLRGAQAEHMGSQGRPLELMAIHLQAKMAQVSHKTKQLRLVLESYEEYLRQGSAPRDHLRFIANIAAPAYNKRGPRLVADSLMMEFLSDVAAKPLARVAANAKTQTSARAWAVARLLSFGHNAQVDWKPIYAAQLNNGSCTMRKEAINGLRSTHRLDAIGLLLREANKRERCTERMAKQAIEELVLRGRSEDIGFDEIYLAQNP